MIGIFYRESEGKVFAISPEGVQINPDSVRKSTYWMSDSVNGHIKGVTSWSGIASKVFNLNDIKSLDDAISTVDLINKTIPREWLEVGLNIRSCLHKKTRAVDKLIKAFPDEVGDTFLDAVRVNKPNGDISTTIDPIRRMNIDNIRLPMHVGKNKVLNYKPINMNGTKSGFYKVNILKTTGILENLSKKTYWVTNNQIAKMRRFCEFEVVNAIQYQSEEGLVSLLDHPSFSPFKEKRDSLKGVAREKFDEMMIRFFLDMPSYTGVHPYSLIMRSQLWGKAIKTASEQGDNGFLVVGFSHAGINIEGVQ